MVNKQNTNEEVAHNQVFESLKQAFLFYDLEKAQDGSLVVKVKNTSLEVSDPETISKVEYANVWFNEITRNVSRSNWGPPKNDERLLNVAFGEIGENTFNKVQESFTNAFERASKNNGSTFGSDVIINLQNAEINWKYGPDVIKALCATRDQVKFANMQGRHPEVFIAKTMEFMSQGYISKQAERGLLWKAKNVIVKVKNAVANALGLSDVSTKSNDQEMSR